MARAQDLILARQHLIAAQRLTRQAFALRAVVLVNKALRAVDHAITDVGPAQPVLDLEPDDASSVSA